MHSDGFSLFELLIVIAISSILTAIGISNWRDIKLRSELSNTTFELITFLNQVKADANIYNINQSVYLFRYDVMDWCLAVTSGDLPIACQTKFKFVPSSNKIEIAGLTMSSNTSPGRSLTFYGRRSTAQATTIRLKNSIGESRVIISTRGRIRYCSYRTYLAGFPRC